MNRRVLLIDADTGFRDTLTRELGRYKGVVVMTEADADRAFAIAAADAPSLIVIAVEEPDKSGYKVFQKCKKGALAKVPVLLVTSSVSADSFAKHRGLKVHADEYIDKRDMSNHELVGKIDNLIVLGDPSDDEVGIPIEDDIPMEIADGDVVVDETVAGDDDQSGPNDFVHEARTVAPGEGGMKLDSLVDAETDAAFASLLGAETPASGPAADASAIPEPVPHTIEDHSEDEPPADEIDQAAPKMELADMQSVPTPVHDGGREPSENFESVSGVHDFEDEGPAVHEAQVPQFETQVAGPLTLESSPAIQLDDSELEPIDDDVPVELAPEDDDPYQEPAPEPAPEPEPAHHARAQSEPVITSAPRPDANTRRAERESSGPRLVDDAPREVHEAATVMAAPIITDDARPEPPRAKFMESSTQSGARVGSGPHAPVDLGLDAVAQDADREQSGVYDRKSLRKIGELERQIAQLKNELERARAAAETAAKGGGRENQFLNLREQNLAKDKELKQLRADFDAQAGQIADLTARVEQAHHAKTALEAKNNQLEERLLEGGNLAKALKAAEDLASQHEAAHTQTKAELVTARSEHEAVLADHATKLARLEQDASSKLAAAETARTALEQELAAERERRTANASEAERALRAEREQVVERHQAELAQVRAEAEAAVAAARSEADAAVATARSEAGGIIAAARDDAEQKVAAAKADTDAKVAAAREDAETRVAAAKAEADAALAAATSEADGALARLRAEAQAALTAALQQQREEQGNAHAAMLDEAIEEVRRANAAEHQEIVGGMEKRHAAELVALKADLAEARTMGDKAAAELRAAHAAELEQLAAKHAAAVESIQEEHQEQSERDSQSHGAALAQLKQELDRAIAGHQTQLATAKQELDEIIAQHEAHKGELHAQHQNAVSTLQQTHEADLAKLHEEQAQLAESARRAAEAHKAALAEAQAKHDAEIAQIQEAAQREVGEAKAAMLALKKHADLEIGKLHANHAELEKAHAAAVAELEAKHERALAVANGDFLKQKSVGDAEHAKQVAALTADHTAKLAEVAAERDEIKRGLSSARDTIKRSEGELASAVQTIADRNAELRAQGVAIAERDQRIADLRKEIEAIEAENTNYQEQVLRAYQKIKADEAMVARARKAMAIALTVLDDQGNPPRMEGPGFTPGPGGDKPPTS